MVISRHKMLRPSTSCNRNCKHSSIWWWPSTKGPLWSRGRFGSSRRCPASWASNITKLFSHSHILCLSSWESIWSSSTQSRKWNLKICKTPTSCNRNRSRYLPPLTNLKSISRRTLINWTKRKSIRKCPRSSPSASWTSRHTWTFPWSRLSRVPRVR